MVADILAGDFILLNRQNLVSMMALQPLEMQESNLACVQLQVEYEYHVSNQGHIHTCIVMPPPRRGGGIKRSSASVVRLSV